MRNAPKTAPKHMHPSQSWRDGWEDAANGRGHSYTMNGYRTVRGDSASEMYYNDGYHVGQFATP